ncbi:hypothetical protein ACF1BE_29760 [Streptomyces sp. NPDC014991]|uniref:hypothetical protein n=1 Tax=Streptomyces sp. NPDC014991 TaxID=3364935 RepID=UPI0036FC8CF6
MAYPSAKLVHEAVDAARGELGAADTGGDGLRMAQGGAQPGGEVAGQFGASPVEGGRAARSAPASRASRSAIRSSAADTAHAVSASGSGSGPSTPG